MSETFRPSRDELNQSLSSDVDKSRVEAALRAAQLENEGDIDVILEKIPEDHRKAVKDIINEYIAFFNLVQDKQSYPDIFDLLKTVMLDPAATVQLFSQAHGQLRSLVDSALAEQALRSMLGTESDVETLIFEMMTVLDILIEDLKVPINSGENATPEILSTTAPSSQQVENTPPAPVSSASSATPTERTPVQPANEISPSTVELITLSSVLAQREKNERQAQLDWRIYIHQQEGYINTMFANLQNVGQAESQISDLVSILEAQRKEVAQKGYSDWEQNIKSLIEKVLDCNYDDIDFSNLNESVQKRMETLVFEFELDAQTLENLKTWTEQTREDLKKKIQDIPEIIDITSQEQIDAVTALDEYLSVVRQAHEIFNETFADVLRKHPDAGDAANIKFFAVKPAFDQLVVYFEDLQDRIKVAQFQIKNPQVFELSQILEEHTADEVGNLSYEDISAYYPEFRKRLQSVYTLIDSISGNARLENYTRIQIVDPAEKRLEILFKTWSQKVVAKYPEHFDSTRNGSLLSVAEKISGTTYTEQQKSQAEADKQELERLKEALLAQLEQDLGDRSLAEDLYSQMDVTQAVSDALLSVDTFLTGIDQRAERKTRIENQLSDVLTNIQNWEKDMNPRMKDTISVTVENDNFKTLIDPLYAQINQARKDFPESKEVIDAIEVRLLVQDYWMAYRVYHKEFTKIERENKGVAFHLQWKKDVAEARIFSRMQRVTTRLGNYSEKGMIAPDVVGRQYVFLENTIADYHRRVGIQLSWAGVWEVMLGAKENTRAFPSSLNPDYFTIGVSSMDDLIHNGHARKDDLVQARALQIAKENTDFETQWRYIENAEDELRRINNAAGALRAREKQGVITKDEKDNLRDYDAQAKKIRTELAQAIQVVEAQIGTSYAQEIIPRQLQSGITWQNIHGKARSKATSEFSNLTTSEKQLFEYENNRRLGKKKTTIESFREVSSKTQEVEYVDTEANLIMQVLDAAYRGDIDLGFNTANFHLQWTNVPRKIVEYIRDSYGSMSGSFDSETLKVLNNIDEDLAYRVMQHHIMFTIHHSVLAKSSAMHADTMYYCFHWLEYATKYYKNSTAKFDPATSMIIMGVMHHKAIEQGQGIFLEGVNPLATLYTREDLDLDDFDWFIRMIVTFTNVSSIDKVQEMLHENKLAPHPDWDMSTDEGYEMKKAYLASGGKDMRFLIHTPYLATKNHGVDGDHAQFTSMEPPLRTMYYEYSSEEIFDWIDSLESHINKPITEADMDRWINLLSYRVNNGVAVHQQFTPNLERAYKTDKKVGAYTVDLFFDDVDELESRYRAKAVYTREDFEMDRAMLLDRVGKIGKYFVNWERIVEDSFEGDLITLNHIATVDPDPVLANGDDEKDRKRNRDRALAKKKDGVGFLNYGAMPLDRMNIKESIVFDPKTGKPCLDDQGRIIVRRVEDDRNSLIQRLNDYSQNVMWLLNNILKSHKSKFAENFKDEYYMGELLKMLGYNAPYLPEHGAKNAFMTQEGNKDYGPRKRKELLAVMTQWKYIAEIFEEAQGATNAELKHNYYREISNAEAQVGGEDIARAMKLVIEMVARIVYESSAAINSAVKDIKAQTLFQS